MWGVMIKMERDKSLRGRNGVLFRGLKIVDKFKRPVLREDN